MTNAVTVGAVFLSGNSLAPSTDTVVGIVTWADLGALERHVIRTVEYWKRDEDHAAREYVRYTAVSHGSRFVSAVRVTDRATFEATRYPTHEAMVASRHGQAVPT